ncbi:splicing factor 3A subunit 2-like [Mya arenaria]|uniref:splicing factor 3A subunit 2-like n=1 Tax=Mya arenaria TaxID=6604 RepID=UPI0022E06409|nr:splicing factor 3A subunit 2-like [Mya arenaria]
MLNIHRLITRSRDARTLHQQATIIRPPPSTTRPPPPGLQPQPPGLQHQLPGLRPPPRGLQVTPIEILPASHIDLQPRPAGFHPATQILHLASTARPPSFTTRHPHSTNSYHQASILDHKTFKIQHPASTHPQQVYMFHRQAVTRPPPPGFHIPTPGFRHRTPGIPLQTQGLHYAVDIRHQPSTTRLPGEIHNPAFNMTPPTM